RFALEHGLLGQAAFHVVADLGAQRVHQVEHLLVRLARAEGEELDDAEDPARAADREGDRSADPEARRCLATGEGGVLTHILDPLRAAGRPHTARYSLVAGVRGLASGGVKAASVNPLDGPRLDADDGV